MLDFVYRIDIGKNRFLFASIREYGWGDPATQGAFWMLVGNLMLSVIFAGVIFGFYYMLVYKKLMTSFVSISKTNMCWTLSDNCRIFPNCATMPEAVFLMRNEPFKVNPRRPVGLLSIVR